jgi:hypothetical protein
VRIAQEDADVSLRGREIQADEAAATLQRLHLLQKGAIMWAAVEGINGVEIAKASPLQQLEDRNGGRANLTDDGLRLMR